MATVAMLLFAAATQGWFLVKSRMWETAALMLIAFSLFRPGFWMDMVFPPYEERQPTELVHAAEVTPQGEALRIRVNGLNEFGDPISFVALLALPDGTDGQARLDGAGVVVAERDGKMFIDDVAFDSPAKAAGLDWDQEVVRVLQPVPVPSKYLLYIPVLGLLALVVLAQRRREPEAAAA